MKKNRITNEARLKLHFQEQILFSDKFKENYSLIKIDPQARFHAMISENGREVLFFKPDLCESFAYSNLSRIKNIDFNPHNNIVLIVGDDIKIVDFKDNSDRNFRFDGRINTGIFFSEGFIIGTFSKEIQAFDYNGRKMWTFSNNLSNGSNFGSIMSSIGNILNSTEDKPIDSKVIHISASLNGVIVCICESGSVYGFDEEGKQLFLFYSTAKLNVNTGLIRIDGEQMFLVGSGGINSIDIKNKHPLWRDPLGFENKIISSSLNNKGNRVLLLDEKSNIFLLDSYGKQLFQEHIDGERIIDTKLSHCGDFIYLLTESCLKYFKLVKHDHEVDEKVSYVELDSNNQCDDPTDNLNHSPDSNIEFNPEHNGTLSQAGPSGMDVFVANEMMNSSNSDSQLEFNVEESMHEIVDYASEFTENTLEFDSALLENKAIADKKSDDPEIFQINCEFSIKKLSDFYPTLNDVFVYFITEDGKIGAYNLKNHQLMFQKDFSCSFNPDNYLVNVPLCGNYFYIYLKNTQSLHAFNWKGTELYTIQINGICKIMSSIKGERLLLLGDEGKSLLCVDGHKGSVLRKKEFNSKITFDADYVIKKFIYSIENTVNIEDFSGKILLKKNFNGDIKAIDIDGSGSSFTFVVGSVCTNLNNKTSKVTNYNIYPDMKDLIVSLNGNTCLVYNKKSVKIIDFDQEKIIIEKEFENLKDISCSLPGDLVIIQTADKVYIKDIKKNSLTTVPRNKDTMYIPSPNGKFIYRCNKNIKNNLAILKLNTL